MTTQNPEISSFEDAQAQPYPTTLGKAWGGAARLPEQSLEITLPIGILGPDGKRYKRVIIDEMSGEDEELISKPIFKKDPAGAITEMFRRIIQEVPGLMKPKRDRNALAPLQMVATMFSGDRDYLMLCVALMSFDHTYTHEWECEKRRCGEENETEIDLSRLAVVDWPDDKDCKIPFKLDRPIKIHEHSVDHGEVRFPTGTDHGKVATASGGDGAKLTQMLALVTSFPGYQPQIVVTKMMMKRMSSRARKAISAQLVKGMPGVDLTVKVTCPECGHVQQEGVDVMAFFGNTQHQ